MKGVNCIGVISDALARAAGLKRYVNKRSRDV